MAALSMSTLAPVLTFAVLLTLASAQNKSSSYNVADEKGWSEFVKEAAKGTGRAPADMSEFVAKVNSNVNNRTDVGGEETDPQLAADVEAFDQSSNGSNSTAEEPETETKTKRDAGTSITTDAMIAAANGGSLAPGEARPSGAFSVKVAGVVGGLLPAIAACFAL